MVGAPKTELKALAEPTELEELKKLRELGRAQPVRALSSNGSESSAELRELSGAQ
jgi:hypothetical protein